jgi:transposase
VRFLNKSNCLAEESLQYFQPLFGVDVSYKYIERLYGDSEVKLALHNLFVLLLKEEGASGDYAGTEPAAQLALSIITELTLISMGKSLFIYSL